MKDRRAIEGGRPGGRTRSAWRWLAGAATLAVAASGIPGLPPAISPAAAAPGAPGSVESVDLELLGRSDLAALGLDGEVKPRGQNGDVDALGDTAFVGGGALFHGTQSSQGRVCTDYGGVKVVDIADPTSPEVLTTISIEDTNGAFDRGNQKFDNVSTSAGAVDAMSVDTAGFTGDLLAIATQRCERPFVPHARVEFWDVTDPANPVEVGEYNPSPTWGIFEDVRMFARGDQLFALVVTPFYSSELQLVDITDPANPVQVYSFPPRQVGPTPAPTPPFQPPSIFAGGSINGCRTFSAGRAAAPTPDGSQAILSVYDPAPNFGNRQSAVFELDLDNLPQAVEGTNNPVQLNPPPSSFEYPLDPAVEANAADVEPFTGPGDTSVVIVSEDDIDPETLIVSVDGPSVAAGDFRGCDVLVAQQKVHQYPDQKIEGGFAYVGRACPASDVPGDPNLVADELLQDPAGKIAIVQGGGNQFAGCSAFDKQKRLQAAGAVAILQSTGGEFLSTIIAGPDGGLPPIPHVVAFQSNLNKFQYVPNPILSAPSATNPDPFPSSFERSSETNVNVVALPVGFRADRGRFRSVADATDRVASGQVSLGGSFNGLDNRFNVIAGESYDTGAVLEVVARSAGSFSASVVWSDEGGNVLSETPIATLDAVTPRTLFRQTVVAPAGATKGAVKFGWSGADAEGTAFADSFFFSPAAITGELRSEPGEWGAQRFVDFTADPATEIANYRSPTSQLFPPPDDGIYAPRLARTVDDRLAFTTWLSDGLRVLDVSDPANPAEVASFVPPAVDDPSPEAGAGGGLFRGQSWPDVTLVTGVDVVPTGPLSGLVTISDINAGLYVLSYEVTLVDGPGLCAGLEPTIESSGTVTGTAGDDVILAGDGDDLIVGGGGNDIICGGLGNDTLDGRAGQDRLFGGAGDDRLIGGLDDDSLDGGDGNDSVAGDAGNDDLDGGAGNDSLRGGAGNDESVGGDGDDAITDGAGDDLLDGGAGNDTSRGGLGTDTLLGGDGNDRLLGEAGDDTLDGGVGTNNLNGGAGTDLCGGSGTNSMGACEGPLP